jgi:hypothetical protein
MQLDEKVGITNSIISVIKSDNNIKDIEDIQPLKKNKNIIIEDDTKNIVIENEINKDIKQKVNFQEILQNIDTINQSIDEQQKSINNLTNKLSKSLK